MAQAKKLPLGVFRELTKAPAPAKITIIIPWNPKLDFCQGFKGFRVIKPNENRPMGLVIFDIPVMPPTVQLDFGNSKDTENIPTVGEVILPKFKKAFHIRWESFFPYDYNAKYINTTVRNLTSDAFNTLKSLAVSTASQISESTFGVDIFQQQSPSPSLYINIFNYLSETEKPFGMSMTFYSGGSLDIIEYTLDSFECEPENNGDFKYSIGLVEYTDIKPKKLDGDGNEIKQSNQKVVDRTENTSGLTDATGGEKGGFLGAVCKFWNFCTKLYSKCSPYLAFAFAAYNGVRNLCFTGAMMAWKIKSSLADIGGRLGILNNILGKSKITSKDTVPITNALKKLSYTKASQELADLIEKYK